MGRKVYNANGIPAVGPYSHAVEAGELVYLSGQTPKGSSSEEIMIGDIGAQTKQCFVNLFEVLKAANLTPDDVIKVNVYLTDMNNFAAMNEVYQTQFNKPYPARTTIGVLALPLGAEVEIEMIAKRP
ncbi:2-iminobutanoate/2-iminopropanoate deaminase [Proteiniborus ethanoligenes]|uniref:2-iminobutanoate/2-iminopropanoate deaminase n=1 Tax=Proteiniborus ethanoligenes TaxID=415015 RepID=A0A1H3RC18_9FIRM|nr:Rid family detoxifying hydrolase [Proteiniborus ethanoligenes]SDZ23186.1 2-iminobutanoate/2-iminopropanoate deaminase [Proteiniborus ethanoligenes]